MVRLFSAGAVLSLALVARRFWLPVGSRHVFDGHEAQYLAVFQGEPWLGSSHMVPVLAMLYTAMGRISRDPGFLLDLNLAASLAGVAALMLLVGSRAGFLPALVAGVGTAIYGNHAFWASSAYNVTIPLTTVLLGMALLGWFSRSSAQASQAMERRGVIAFGISAITVGLGVGMRPDLCPVLLVALFLLPRGHFRAGLAWASLVGLVAVGSAWPILATGAHPQGLGQQAWTAMRYNIAFLELLSPWSQPLMLLSLLVCLPPALVYHPRHSAMWLTLGGI